MAWANERIACICFILIAIFRYNCAGKSCDYHWQCSPDEKCCKRNCSTNCSLECSVSSDCTLDERCCYYGVYFARKCGKFCSIKTCQYNHDCGFGQICCARNSGIRRCERSCTFGKRCTSDLSCGSREYCCLNRFGTRQCARSCTFQKTCNRNQDCISSERCCGSGVKKCRRDCSPEKDLSCFTDETCSTRNIGECCKNGVCQENCDDSKARNWYISIGVFAFIFFLMVWLFIQSRKKLPCFKAAEEEALENTGGRQDVDTGLENQQQYVEEVPSGTQNSQSHPNYPPSYSIQPPLNKYTAPIPDYPPPPYPGLPEAGCDT